MLSVMIEMRCYVASGNPKVVANMATNVNSFMNVRSKVAFPKIMVPLAMANAGEAHQVTVHVR